MSSAIGWYGPRIDLSAAWSHLDDFVQLIVFVRSMNAIQKDNVSVGGTLLKTKIQVGDDTRSFFSISLWQKHMGSMIVAGDVILLQNVKIVKHRNVLEAATTQISTLLVLVHSYELGSCKDLEELVSPCRVGETSKTKLRRVIHWVWHTESALQHVKNVESCQRKGQTIKNWKAYEGKKSWKCMSISEALRLNNSCTAIFDACIGEIFLPFLLKTDEVEKEQSFVSKRLLMMTKKDNIVEDFISPGCKLCGSTIGSSNNIRQIPSRSIQEQSEFPLRCQRSSKYHHEICLIYRPFLLYVWDQGGQIPLLVKNQAAQILFGNITAENVYNCYHEKGRNPILSKDSMSMSLRENKEIDGALQIECNTSRMKPDFYRIWLILIKVLLQQDKNSPYCFEISVDPKKDVENGRLELLSFTMPCNGGGSS